MRKSSRSNLSSLQRKKLMRLFTILRTCLWGGMASLFLTGCTNSMDLELSTNVRYVEITVIGDEGLLRCISRSGVILTG